MTKTRDYGCFTGVHKFTNKMKEVASEARVELYNCWSFIYEQAKATMFDGRAWVYDQTEVVANGKALVAIIGDGTVNKPSVFLYDKSKAYILSGLPDVRKMDPTTEIYVAAWHPNKHQFKNAKVFHRLPKAFDTSKFKEMATNASTTKKYTADSKPGRFSSVAKRRKQTGSRRGRKATVTKAQFI